MHKLSLENGFPERPPLPQRHIILEITPPPLTLFPLSAGAFARHSNGKLLIFICPLDFCAGLHILEVGNASVRIA